MVHSLSLLLLQNFINFILNCGESPTRPINRQDTPQSKPPYLPYLDYPDLLARSRYYFNVSLFRQSFSLSLRNPRILKSIFKSLPEAISGRSDHENSVLS